MQVHGFVGLGRLGLVGTLPPVMRAPTCTVGAEGSSGEENRLSRFNLVSPKFSLGIVFVVSGKAHELSMDALGKTVGPSSFIPRSAEPVGRHRSRGHDCSVLN